MDSDLVNSITLGLIFYIILLCSVCLHEWAHAFAADKLGDRLPRSQGRVTLNPVAHIDPLGTVILPLLMIFIPILSNAHAPVALLGWGKPVMISLPNPKTRIRDDLVITAAGPLCNLIICIICSAAGGLFFRFAPDTLALFYYAILINAALFAFNLIPIPPLDGSHFLKHAFRMSEEAFVAFSRWGFFILIVLINIPAFQMFLGFIILSVEKGLSPIFDFTAGLKT